MWSDRDDDQSRGPPYKTLHHTNLTLPSHLCVAEMGLSQLAVPSVYALIGFLAYSPQILLLYLEPYPISRRELVQFNILLACLLICYTRSVFVDPGRIPADYTPEQELEKSGGKQTQTRKWCRKCNVAKPPRAHHCSTCKR
jgi:palmitoyltransferase